MTEHFTVIVPVVGRRLTMRAPSDLRLGELVERIVSDLHLPLFDSQNHRYFSYVCREPIHGELLDQQRTLGENFDAYGMRGESQGIVMLDQVGGESKLSPSKMGLATFTSLGTLFVHELEEMLRDLRLAYEAILASDILLNDPHSRGEIYRRHDLQGRHSLITENLSANERLLTRRITINSPGVLEVIGRLNPLETIRQFLKDRRDAETARREADKRHAEDEAFRNPIKQAKAMLEIESLKTRVAHERMQILRDAGFSQEAIRPYVTEIIERPLAALQVHVGRVSCESVIALDSTDIEIVEDHVDSDFAKLLALGPGDED